MNDLEAMEVDGLGLSPLESSSPSTTGSDCDVFEDGVPTDWILMQIEEHSSAPFASAVPDGDTISCVEFSEDGEMLATGDKAGGVTIYERSPSEKYVNGYRSNHYRIYTSFQSHEPEFDYLKSIEIEERIKQIKWLKKGGTSNLILTSNDKTVKLLRITERQRKLEGGGLQLTGGGDGFIQEHDADALTLPSYVPMEVVVETTIRRIYANAHLYHVNSVSLNSDQETFISADDLRINLWNLEVTDVSFNIVDLKPPNLDDLAEVISTAEFHPTHCNLLIYGSSKGVVRLCDLRDRSHCDLHAKWFEATDSSLHNSFFSEIVDSISDVKFSHDGRYFLARDFLTVKVWDMNMEKQPVATFGIHDYLHSQLCKLYESDCIFDKFEARWSADNRQIVTGSYNGYFRIFSLDSVNDVLGNLVLDAEVNRPGDCVRGKLLSSGGLPRAPGKTSSRGRQSQPTYDGAQFDAKLLYTGWHPKEDLIAIANGSQLFLYRLGGH